uniref:Podocalyxin n=1 Tax=Rhinolophus ferrumequinum TaxID=59479 RepID=A0A671F5B2_RHIFE
MRCALPLLALLLRLLLPLPSLSQNETTITQDPTTTARMTAATATVASTRVAQTGDGTTASKTAAPTTAPTSASTTAAPTAAPKTAAPTTALTSASTTAAPTTAAPTTAAPTTAAPTTAAPTTNWTATQTAETQCTSGQCTSGQPIETQPTQPQSAPMTPQPSHPVNTPNPSAGPPPVTSPPSTQQPAPSPITPKGSGSTPEGPKDKTTASMVTTQENQQTFKPAIPGTTALGPAATPPDRTTGSSTQIECQPLGRLKEKMLILNVTKTSRCAKSLQDDKLAALLCQAAKSTFNPTQDQCHIQLEPVPDIQSVAIKEISIQTHLLPEHVYELLRDKWEDLKELGVSHMQLGDQGPPEETEDRFSMPLIITIVCMASFLLLVAALYGCCHQRLSHRKDQQRLTEELQTVENGYHDNPTLEVMETPSDMQEKKVVNLNGELGDSWIVPLDNLTKDELEEEEDTHL